MELTNYERKYLIRLLRFHQRPPTWKNQLPTFALALVAPVAALGATAWLDTGKVDSPLVYFLLGCFYGLFLVLLGYNRNLIRLWRVADAVVRWEHIELLLAGDESDDNRRTSQNHTPGSETSE